ncbi:abortive infection family protein [Carnobacterium maltaromaticum]|uniref:Abortive infection family protein n=1 Tax=Carnobacterium maltaromaticum TaxID=2751 RepID=A0AAW9K0H9_CARML|nr:abortive infection family protein [Carnobacterium maltaromaticum]MDZ5760354.1 abortive infection family protein [Carnobacterium maltaromaticum]
MLSGVDKRVLSKMFNDDGYVMDFTTDQFDEFTNYYVGFGICEKYGLSKGKSLEFFFEKEDTKLTVILLKALIDYHDSVYDDLEKKIGKETVYYKTLEIIRELESEREDKIYSYEFLNSIHEKFDSAYISNQIKMMENLIEKSPSDAIGKSKELIESCCKSILTSFNIEIENGLNLNQLTKKTFNSLKLSLTEIEEKKLNDTIKKILSSLGNLTNGIAELRNTDGTGHGKDNTYKSLPPRYARLAVGSSITLVHFLWETYEYQKLRE